MARKSKKKALPKKNTELSNKIKFLHKLVELSLRAADSSQLETKEIFNQQAYKLLGQIQELEKNQ